MSAETTSFPRRAPWAWRRSGVAVRSRWAGLVVASLGMLMAFLNITQTVAVLEPLQRDLHATSAEFVWVASVYTMVVASLDAAPAVELDEPIVTSVHLPAPPTPRTAIRGGSPDLRAPPA